MFAIGVSIVFLLLSIMNIYLAIEKESAGGFSPEAHYGGLGSVYLFIAMVSMLYQYEWIQINKQNVWLYIIAGIVVFFIIGIVVICIITLFQWIKENKEKRT